jgi:DNA-directed RNA polymerase specialized sigma24 family protein
MGKSNHDAERLTRDFENEYDLTHEKGIKNVLDRIHKLHEQRFFNQAIVDFLFDLKRAVKLAELTEAEKKALYWKYEREYSTKEVAEKLGTGKRNVQMLLKSGRQKIADVFFYWKGHGQY